MAAKGVALNGPNGAMEIGSPDFVIGAPRAFRIPFSSVLSQFVIA